MNHHLVFPIKSIFYFITLLFLSSCVSVSLGTDKAKKSTELKIVAPGKAFVAIENQNVDQAWQNPNTGNTIAYTSECHSKVESSLDLMESESLSAISNTKILKSDTAVYNERESKEVLAEGSVDGIPVKMQVILFKKNQCNYIITFVGRKKSFDSDLDQFSRFKEGFQAP